MPTQPVDVKAILRAGIEMHVQAVAGKGAELEESFAAAVELCENTLRSGGKIVLFGNGGSAADAQHLAAELTVRFVKDRPALAALALTTDTSVLTACGNDLGFEKIFARQVEALVRKDDVVIGITTSGGSPNVVSALRKAREIGAATIALSGRTGDRLGSVCDVALLAPGDMTALIQEIHILLGHMLCEALERRLELA